LAAQVDFNNQLEKFARLQAEIENLENKYAGQNGNAHE